MKKGIEGILSKLDDRDWFECLLEEAFKKSKEIAKIKHPNKAIDYFYASWAGDCVRQIQYSMNGMMPEDGDPQGQRRMDNGNYVHNRYGEYFKLTGKLVEAEPPFKKVMDGVLVSGRGDFIVLKVEDTKVLIELKSINSKGFQNVLTTPLEGDYLQWNLCAKALDFKDGIVLYENKDNQDEKHHFVTFNEDEYKRVINDFILIDKHNKAGTLVPKPEICVSPKWCSARGFCK